MKTKTFTVYRGMHDDLGDESIVLVDEVGVVYTLSPHDQPLIDFFDFDQVTEKRIGDKIIKETPPPIASFEIEGEFQY